MMSTGNKSNLDEINLKERIEQFAWKRFRETHGFFTRLFTLKNRYYVDIKWDYRNFDHTTYEKQPGSEKKKKKEKKNLELYFCDNKTDNEQVHKFSTSRQTTATTSIEFQKNYTLGATTNIEVDLGFVKAGCGVNGRLSVTNTNGQSFSESFTWNIDTEIKVPAKQKAKAELHVYEEQSITDFEVQTKVTLPKKKFPISIRRISDDKLMGHTIWIKCLDIIFDKDYLEKSQEMVKVDEDHEIIDGKKYIYKALVLKSHGTAQIISFKNQHLIVESTPILGYEAWKKDQAETSKKDKAEGVNKDGGESPQ